MTLLRWALGSLVLLYLVAVATLYLLQRSLLYPIPQATRTSPAAAGFAEAEEVVADTADGERVILWHVPPKGDRPVVVFFHGNGDILAWRVPRFRALTADGTVKGGMIPKLEESFAALDEGVRSILIVSGDIARAVAQPGAVGTRLLP